MQLTVSMNLHNTLNYFVFVHSDITKPSNFEELPHTFIEEVIRINICENRCAR